MDKILESISKKILNKINLEKQEYIIVLYGIHQILLILLNIFTVLLLGSIWDELIFSALLFLWIVILRPFAGGYHADTEFQCYLMSVVALNIILACKAYISFSVWQYLLVWFISAIIIWRLAPVENSSNLLNENEIQVYKNKTKVIIKGFFVFILLGIFFKVEWIYSSNAYALLLISFFSLFGKRKYRV